jgi:hypothetical protein
VDIADPSFQPELESAIEVVLKSFHDAANNL